MGLSRRNQIQSTEWFLSPQVFKQISKIWESPQVDLFATRLNTKLPLYVSPILDPQAWAVDALNIQWENLVAYAFPPTALLPKVVQKLQSQMCRLLLIAPGWPSKPWFWDLVEMSLDMLRRLPQIRTLLKQPINNVFHSNPATLNLHVWYLGAHRCNNEGSLQRWQRELLLLKDSQQEPSTPQNGLFSRWCMEQQVDFGSPSIGDICSFFWYLFHDLNRCPSTIEGYRTTIADTLGDFNLRISSNTDIARLISSFYRDKPKKSRLLPKWNLSLVLHKLTQPPFEPQEECTLKLLTWKTVFLLALASGKMRSEIHAWTYDGTLSLGNWEQVQLTPSPFFIAKNQLAKEGPNIASPVIIPALKCDQDSQNMDILLCPVRALKCYLDRTKETRTSRRLLFISYKLGHSKDIQCSTISSWIKNTTQFCYSKV